MTNLENPKNQLDLKDLLRKKLLLEDQWEQTKHPPQESLKRGEAQLNAIKKEDLYLFLIANKVEVYKGAVKITSVDDEGIFKKVESLISGEARKEIEAKLAIDVINDAFKQKPVRMGGFSSDR